MAFGLDDAINAGLQIINKLIPDANARQAAADDLRKAMFDAAAKAESDQRDIDKTEAANASLFVAGWRPAVGWLCVLTLGYSWMAAPLVTWTLTVAHLSPLELPTLGASDSQTLLYALLGIGGLRTVDKMTGNATTGIKGIISSITGSR